MPRPKNDFLSCMWWHWQKIHRKCSNRQLQRMRRNWPTPLRCLWWGGRSRTSRFSTGTSEKGLQRPSIFVSISGSLAKFAAMHRASSRVSRLAARPGSSSKVTVSPLSRRRRHLRQRHGTGPLHTLGIPHRTRFGSAQSLESPRNLLRQLCPWIPPIRIRPCGRSNPQCIHSHRTCDLLRRRLWR